MLWGLLPLLSLVLRTLYLCGGNFTQNCFAAVQGHAWEKQEQSFIEGWLANGPLLDQKCTGSKDLSRSAKKNSHRKIKQIEICLWQTGGLQPAPDTAEVLCSCQVCKALVSHSGHQLCMLLAKALDRILLVLLLGIATAPACSHGDAQLFLTADISSCPAVCHCEPMLHAITLRRQPCLKIFIWRTARR
jgi:hypothetical protein